MRIDVEFYLRVKLEQITSFKRLSQIYLSLHGNTLKTLLGTKVHSTCTRKYSFKTLEKLIIDSRDQHISYLRPLQHGLLNEEVCRRRYVLEKANGKLFFSSYRGSTQMLIGGVFSTTYILATWSWTQLHLISVIQSRCSDY